FKPPTSGARGKPHRRKLLSQKMAIYCWYINRIRIFTSMKMNMKEAVAENTRLRAELGLPAKRFLSVHEAKNDNEHLRERQISELVKSKMNPILAAQGKPAPTAMRDGVLVAKIATQLSRSQSEQIMVEVFRESRLTFADLDDDSLREDCEARILAAGL